MTDRTQTTGSIEYVRSLAKPAGDVATYDNQTMIRVAAVVLSFVSYLSSTVGRSERTTQQLYGRVLHIRNAVCLSFLKLGGDVHP